MEIKTTEQFINLIAPAVVENCQRHGWGVPSAIIAQATLESMKSTGWSGLASTCFNFWGMKWSNNCGCDYKEYTTAEQRADGSYYNIVARFRKYPTIDGIGGGIDGYFRFIESYKRYAKVMTAKDYKTYAIEIRSAGWATSLSYTNNIINRVEKYNLTRFDNVAAVPQSDYTIGKTYTLQSDLYIRLTPDGDKMEMKSLTSNAQINAFTDAEGYSILRKGTRVTCKGVKELEKSTWMNIPSGWICAKNSTKTFVK